MLNQAATINNYNHFDIMYFECLSFAYEQINTSTHSSASRTSLVFLHFFFSKGTLNWPKEIKQQQPKKRKEMNLKCVCSRTQLYSQMSLNKLKWWQRNTRHSNAHTKMYNNVNKQKSREKKNNNSSTWAHLLSHVGINMLSNIERWF